MLMKGNLGLIVGGTTFVLFMVEGILHFNMGKDINKTEEEKKFSIPDKKELIKIALIVGSS